MKYLALLLLIVSCAKSEKSNSNKPATVTPKVTVDLLDLKIEEFEKSLSVKNLKALGVSVLQDAGVTKISICGKNSNGPKTKRFLEKLQEIFTNKRIESIIMGEYKLSKPRVLGAVGLALKNEITCSEPQELIVLN